ncbi:MAG: sensor histidine kinase [Bacteroidetes bacterium]|nr:sensor histidine kinase [Bacteroidota bacterium]
MSDKVDLIMAIAFSTIVMATMATFIIYFIIIYRKKQRAFEWEREVFKQALLKTEVEIKEQTLSDISRELHDNLGQMASLIKINLNLVLPRLSAEEGQKISESLDLLKQLIKDIKSLSVSLKGENLARFGLLKMIEKDIERYERAGGLKINLSVAQTLPLLEPAIEVFLYRMSQEIFNNILKHANASEVEVTVSFNSPVFRLGISDNGKGFDSNLNPAGSGLVNLKERCQMIGARLDLKSGLNQGTTVAIELNV